MRKIYIGGKSVVVHMNTASNVVKRSVLISSVMILLVVVALSGCLDSGVPPQPAPTQPAPTQPGQTSPGQGGKGPLTVKITSPKDTALYKRGEELTFDATVSGGVPPYTFRWDSTRSNAPLSTERTFKYSGLQIGQQLISITVTDSTGKGAKNEIWIDVM